MSKLTDAYAAAFAACTTAEELEHAIQNGPKHPFHGAPWRRISDARIEAGRRICAAHPHGFYIPLVGERRKLTVCGETYRVGYGQNGAGERWVWNGAQSWARTLQMQNGLSRRATYDIWDAAPHYPHRALEIVAAALAGKIKDPRLGYLYRHERTKYATPIKYSVEANERSHNKRATRPCPTCGGTLFDWGAGFSRGFDSMNWHCNACPDAFTEYMSREKLYRLRNPRRPTAIAA